MNDELELLKSAKNHILDGDSNNALKVIDVLIGMKSAEDGKIDPEERELINKSAPGTVGGDRG